MAEEEGGEGEGADADVEDMAGATFTGHSDAVYCVAVNPKNSSQVKLKSSVLRLGVFPQRCV